ncbi:MAG TPA: hypothetical protein VLE27_17230, partial [Thermoanaerobaculia bacterium]|nr:hypothetical protein [Thermoanaerobaculia bacterium]
MKTGAVLGVCAALAAVLAWQLPLAADDPFRGTLVILPLILGGLREIHRWAVIRGGRALPVQGTAGELAALAVLVLLV